MADEGGAAGALYEAESREPFGLRQPAPQLPPAPLRPLIPWGILAIGGAGFLGFLAGRRWRRESWS